MEQETRQAIVEPDYRLESLKAAATLKNIDLAQLLTNADRIEKWLNEPKENIQKKIFEKWKTVKEGDFTFHIKDMPGFDE